MAQNKNLQAELTEQSALPHIMESKGWDLGQVAQNIGDSQERLQKVEAGEEPLGKTALLAIIAVCEGLSPIERE